MTEDERAIRELVETWMRASKAGDIVSVLDLMTDDVIFMVPGGEPFGKEEFRVASEAMPKPPPTACRSASESSTTGLGGSTR